MPPSSQVYRHLSGSTFAPVSPVGLLEWQRKEWFPLGLGLVVDDKPTKLSCS